MNWMDYIAAAPEMTVLGLICFVLIADLFVDDEHRVLTYWMAIGALGITLWSLFATVPVLRDGALDSLNQSLILSDQPCGRVK